MNNEKYKIINCLNINSGGGLVLLNLFLERLNNIKVIYVDKKLKINKSIYYKKSITKKSNFLNNFLTYKSLSIKENSEIYFYNGLAPIFKLKIKTYLVFHNANIFKNSFRKNWFFSKDFLRNLYFKLFNKNIDKFIVFSAHAREILINNNINKKKNSFSRYYPKY